MAHLDSSSWPSYAEIDPEYKKFLETATPSSPLPSDPSQHLRVRVTMAMMQHKARLQQIDRTGVAQEKHWITAKDGHLIPAVLYKPSTPTSGPLAVLFHGGGFVVGDPEMEAPAAVTLVQHHNATVISVGYRLAPENPYPQAVNDGLDALIWAVRKASSLGADLKKGFLLGGSSAGGNIAAVLSHMARDTKASPPLTAIWLNCPLTVGFEAVPEALKKDYHSLEQNADAPGMFNKEGLVTAYSFYKPNQSSQLFSPLLWESGHQGLPKTQLHVYGLDPLRDDSLLYARELAKAGVDTRVDVYPGVPHGFDFDAPQLQQAAKFREDRQKAFQWLLG
ncbi:hypothetical protein CKM354_000178200 [Cercospora kikuchii]|uniref:Alpha/beta hydrolase fold-3 domain-containing protein n=1 Tax=Cercospora kikuchii TaxID=84275 RepID=A0A9P3C8Q2_9PEZI|nr:uncharacterized protein CKM354_000178200 [Cercospora kikuchii]GIZ38363.1 hypothetical protein CKM354_000178200 [Cercospora kikuchii]